MAEEAARPEADRKRLEWLVNDTLRQLGHAPDPSVGQYLDQWLKDEREAISEARFDRLNGLIRQFCRSVGFKPIREVNVSDISRFRDQLLKEGLSPATINNRLGSLKRIFRVAYESGVIDRNPVALVRAVKNGGNSTNGTSTFTPEQIRMLVATAEGDWKGLILAGFFTGARLMDLARLEWSNVSSEFIQFRQGKTGGFVQIPIHQELQEWLKTSVNGRFVFPTLAVKDQTTLSWIFSSIVNRAGIDAGVSRRAHGGRAEAEGI